MSKTGLNEHNTSLTSRLPRGAVAYQFYDNRRGWVECTEDFAFNRASSYTQVRALQVMPPETRFRITDIVVVPKPDVDLGEVDIKIVNWIDNQMVRQYRRDESYGYVGAKEVASALNISKAFIRSRLEALASGGHIRRVEFSNAIMWQSINLLPFEASQRGEYSNYCGIKSVYAK